MVVGAGLASAGLFLRTLRLRQHHGTRHGHVRSFSRGHSCGRRASLSCSVVVGIFFQPGRVVNSLWHDSRTNLFRRRLRETTNVVDIRATRFSDHYSHLGYLRIYLVESSETLVANVLWQVIRKLHW